MTIRSAASERSTMHRFLTGGGELFYEAATVLAAFVLLGHGVEMRARGGANEAIRLLELASR